MNLFQLIQLFQLYDNEIIYLFNQFDSKEEILETFYTIRKGFQFHENVANKMFRHLQKC